MGCAHRRSALPYAPPPRVVPVDFARGRTVADAEELGTRIGNRVCIAFVVLVCLCSESLVDLIVRWVL